MKEQKEYTNSQIAAIIDDCIHNAKYREILKDRFIDGLTYEQIAEKHDITPRHCQRIIYRQGGEVLKYI